MKKYVKIRQINFNVFKRIAKYQLKKYLEEEYSLQTIMECGIPKLEDMNDVGNFVKWAFCKIQLPTCAVIDNNHVWIINNSDSIVILPQHKKYVSVSND